MEVIGGSYDAGRDLVGTWTLAADKKIAVVVQCKRQRSSRVAASFLREFEASMWQSMDDFNLFLVLVKKHTIIVVIAVMARQRNVLGIFSSHSGFTSDAFRYFSSDMQSSVALAVVDDSAELKFFRTYVLQCPQNSLCCPTELNPPARKLLPLLSVATVFSSSPALNVSKLADKRRKDSSPDNYSERQRSCVLVWGDAILKK